MSYGGKGDTYNNYGQSEGGEHGNETVGAEPEYERRIGAPQAPPGYIFQNTLSYATAPNAFVQGYPSVLPPVTNPYVNTAPGYPQQPGYPIGSTVQQPVLPLYPMMDTSQVPGIQSSPYPLQPYTEATDTQPEIPTQDYPQQGVVVYESHVSRLDSMFCKRRIVIGIFGVTAFVIFSIVRAIVNH